MDFVHLHVQSAYSLLSSTVRIDDLIQAATDNGMDSIALADRNVMYGAVPFYKACKAAGIKPIIGLLADVLHEEQSHPLLLLAKNQAGYKNLLKISSAIQTKSKAGIPLRWLKGYSAHLIAISPGREGYVESCLASESREEAEAAVILWKELFGSSNVYLSLQEGCPLEGAVRQLAMDTETLTVATSPVLYMKPEDELAYRVMQALKLGVKLSEMPSDAPGRGTGYFKTGEEVLRAFQDSPEAVRNSVRIAASCEVEIPFHQKLLPKYPGDMPAGELLAQLCREGFRERYPDAPKPYWDRLQYELDVISKMNYSDYFLIVWDFMKFARQNHIMTGPGRGSAAGSMVAYVLRITDVDPMKYNLLFERFLNPERISMPDIDIDFSDIRRDEVIAYVAEKYGALHVAQIITFGTFAAKASLRDTGRVFGLNTRELEQLSKMVPGRVGLTIKDALRESKQLQSFYESDELNRKLIDTALKLEGLPRHTSTHAAGVVISNLQLTESIAIQEGHDGIHLTQSTMDQLEELGLLKMDFLGLRNLTLMERVIQSIRRKTGKAIDIRQLPMNDEATMRMLGTGDTAGIFQFESEGMQNVLKQLKPEKFTELVAVNALYRPGPMDNIPSYIRRKNGEEPVEYLHSDLEEILKDTYGIIVYQEQIMQIASRFAGFSLGEADLLRRAVSKKKGKELEQQRMAFVQGSIKQGYPRETAETIYNDIVKFANYGFPLAHATAYSLIAYQLAYLKAHYPAYFMAALMSNAIGNDAKIASYARQLRKMDIPLLGPSINTSFYPFQAEEEGISFSLAAIKGVGGNAVKEIVQARKDRPFTDLFDFCIRVPLHIINRKMLEALVHAGAFDEWGMDRATLLASLDVAIDHAELVSGDGESFDLFEQTGFDIKPKYIEVDPIPLETKLEFEKEVLGFYISDHPLASHKKLFRHFGAVPLYTAIEETDKRHIISAYIAEERTIRTKKGEVMAFLTLADESDELEAVAFPAAYKKHAVHLSKGSIAILSGVTELRNGKPQFIVNDLYPLEELREWQKEESEILYIRLEKNADQAVLSKRVNRILKKYPGKTRVMLYQEKESRTIQLPLWDWVQVSPSLIGELKEAAGNRNVIVKNI
ncbi:DNA polymerase III subunit alpha [Bacillus testis]|uniref:DNA polymerase III subunit alpha n=1 Tax=Bacillus testis TaxID=1622072 RepID=UPI00067F4808|nr:DNA polymerase III subunit alpha [Bacillus testis]